VARYVAISENIATNIIPPNVPFIFSWEKAIKVPFIVKYLKELYYFIFK